MASASPEVIRTWACSCNRGAFVVCALLKVKGAVSRTVAAILSPLTSKLRESSLKGHQAILNELAELNS